jgi:D-glycero-D-manno-heptose 1,7-bisphosphate phosphatase
LSTRLLFLDRDGTLNASLGSRPPNDPSEVALLPNTGPVLSRCVSEGWQLVIVTNQGGVAAGYLAADQAYAVQQRVIDLLPVPVAAAYLCPHMPQGVVPAYVRDCPNRKPRPGFLLRALHAFGAQAGDCLLVGDSVTDQQAAVAAAVPFCWADRFFGRPIERGLHTCDGEWVQLREDREATLAAIQGLDGRGDDSPWPGAGESIAERVERAARDGRPHLCLVAVVQGHVVGWSALVAAGGPGDATAAELTLEVDRAHRRQGIGSSLVETTLEWAVGRPGLERICAPLCADDALRRWLCGRFGLAPRDGPGTRVGGSVQRRRHDRAGEGRPPEGRI